MEDGVPGPPRSVRRGKSSFWGPFSRLWGEPNALPPRPPASGPGAAARGKRSTSFRRSRKIPDSKHAPPRRNRLVRGQTNRTEVRRPWGLVQRNVVSRPQIAIHPKSCLPTINPSIPSASVEKIQVWPEVRLLQRLIAFLFEGNVNPPWSPRRAALARVNDSSTVS